MRKAGIYGPLIVMLVTIGCLTPPSARAQDDSKGTAATKPVSAYRLEFVLSEVEDGKKINSRNYVLLAQEGIMNKLRVGARVPVNTATGAQSQIQYMDVGMNIDCRVQEREGFLLLDTTADFSSFALREEQKAQPISGNPVLQSLRSQVNTVVSAGKPTVISSMDDPSSRRQFQIEVTATKVR